MSVPALAMAIRLRALQTASIAIGLGLVIVMVGALFPAVGHSIGKLHLPEGVTELLGGADYGTIRGWMRSEIGAIYGPLIASVTAIGGAVASTAGEEQAGILDLVLAYPLERSALILAKAAAVALEVLAVCVSMLVGLIVGVAVAGGGISLRDLIAISIHLFFFGLVVGALALAVATATGRRGLATAVAGGFAVLGFLINGFAPLVGALSWLKYLSPFYYYEGHDPIANGIEVVDLVVLAVATSALVGLAILGMRRRDLRA